MYKVGFVNEILVIPIFKISESQSPQVIMIKLSVNDFFFLLRANSFET